MNNRDRLRILVILAIAAAGAASCVCAAARLDTSSLGLSFVLLIALTLGVGSRLGVSIPRVKGEVTLSDIFLFLTLLLYGGEVAVLLAATEALFTSVRLNRRLISHLFNSGVMSLSIFIAARALEFCFGSITALRHGGFSPQYLGALAVLTIVHYSINSSLVALCVALKSAKSPWEVWRSDYLWTSLNVVAAASVAGVVAKTVDAVGIYEVVGMLPVVAFVYLTYLTYLRNMKATQERAQLAQQHVEELSRYIAEQERIREQFTQVEKLSALGVLASGVAHNFNNTLASILGRAEMMLTQTTDAKMRRGLEIIVKSSQDGAQTVRRIQDFARQRKDHDFRPVSIAQLLSDVSEITRPRWKDAAEAAGVYITLQLRSEARAIVSGEGAELRDVLVNMVFNAVDAMPEGGVLCLSSEDVDGFALVEVSDTGEGMTDEVRARAFDPFFTTKSTRGMGLGLAVSYGVISRHGGTIEVESEVGRGTTFRIKLPAAYVPRGDADASEASGVGGFRRLKMAKILVVDDEAAVRELLCEILEDAGCETEQAASGREALALFDAKRFDAVFTDIGMPGMSGWELAHALRERDERLPLAVITGWGETVGDSQREAARVNWLMSKPFSMAQIIEVGEEVIALREAAAQNEIPAGAESCVAC
ncbi:MAG TPA: ATP-binding protein [Pyrinomonadaceae bacterium]|nr:ATP-binding protein [Pyrinomonadaceae bacterium]